MIRIVLRNIQFYLLLSSGILALIAFQHLNWYGDQEILPYTQSSLLDKPSYGSPDDGGTIYYGGESKEIGIFKFRVGLFKFALPTFAKDELAWEGSRWKTVPVPPNRKRKGRDELLRRQYVNVRQRNDKSKATAKKASVAYVVNFPLEDELTSTLQRRAAVLAASIKKAHVNSSYEYQLHAINYSGSDIEKSYTCNQSCQETLTDLGYKVINLSSSDLVNEIMSREKKKQSHMNESLKKLLDNTVVVNLALDSYLLKSIESAFDDFFKESKSKNQLLRNDASPSILALEQTTKDINHNPLYIFKPSANEATDSYLEFLKCSAPDYVLNNNKQSSLQAKTSVQRRDSWQPTLYPKIRSLLALAVPTTEIKRSNEALGKKQCVIDNSNAVLNRCIYSAGSYNCPEEDVENSTIVASFTGDVCSKPWECERNENGDGCVNPSRSNSTFASCDFLQRAWLGLANSL